MIEIQAGVIVERARIVGLINDRIEDLKTCGKDDNCHDLARILEVVISDIESERV